MACLEAFGPIHGWWSYPFERYNGVLQWLNTNYKPSALKCFILLVISTEGMLLAEMLKTFMRYFYIRANLRWLISTIDWPALDVFQVWFEAFRTAFREATRGTRFSDIPPFPTVTNNSFQYSGSQESLLPRPIYDQLYNFFCQVCQEKRFSSAYHNDDKKRPHLPHNGQLVKSIEHNGVKYMTSSSGARNSFVIFTDPLMPSWRVAGQIETIFYHHRAHKGVVTTEPFISIREFTMLMDEDKQHDPFQAFPELDAAVYYNKLADNCKVIPLDGLVSHFALLKWTPTGVDAECIVAKSLDRVSIAASYMYVTHIPPTELMAPALA